MALASSRQRREAGQKHAWRDILCERQAVCFLTHRQKLLFYSQLRSLARSGLGVVEILSTMASRRRRGLVGRALEQACMELERGKGMGEALAPYGYLFGAHYVELLDFGFKTGTLDQVLDRIIEDLERQQSIRREALSPCLYLLYLLVTVVVFGPLAGVGPTLQRRAEGDAISGVMVSSYFGGLFTNLLLLGLGLAIYLGVPLASRWSGRDVLWDVFKMRNPFTSGLFRNLYAGRLFGNLELAVSSGMSMPRAVELSAKASGSSYIRSRASQMVRALDGGLGLADAIERLQVIPSDLVATLAAGERAGRMEETLGTLSREAREAATTQTKITLTMVTSIIMGILMALVVIRIWSVFAGPLHYYLDLKLE